MKLRAGVTRYILEGKHGLSMLEDAMAFSEEILQTKKLSKHPDFLLIELGDKKELTVEDAMAVISKTAFAPVIGDYIVIVIDSFDSMNETAQNKLLKTLEDEKRLYLILISYGGRRILETVRSRCTLVRYLPISLLEWEKQFPDKDSFCSYYATEGCPGELVNKTALTELFKEVWRTFEAKSFENLLPVLHLLTEKDKDAVTASPYIPQILTFLDVCALKQLNTFQGDPIKRELYLRMEQLIGKNIESLGRRYAKENFFLLIANIVSLSKNGGI